MMEQRLRVHEVSVSVRLELQCLVQFLSLLELHQISWNEDHLEKVCILGIEEGGHLFQSSVLGFVMSRIALSIDFLLFPEASVVLGDNTKEFTSFCIYTLQYLRVYGFLCCGESRVLHSSSRRPN